jgi:hypothetical protein
MALPTNDSVKMRQKSWRKNAAGTIVTQKRSGIALNPKFLKIALVFAKSTVPEEMIMIPKGYTNIPTIR